MIKNLMQVGLHLGVSAIDFLTKMARVLGNLFALTQVAANTLTEAVRRVGQLCIDNFGLQRLRQSRLLLSGNQPSRRWRADGLGRRPLRSRSRLLAPGLRLGLSAHLSNAAEEF